MKSAINWPTVIIPTDDTVTVFDEYKNDLTIWAEISNVLLKKTKVVSGLLHVHYSDTWAHTYFVTILILGGLETKKIGGRLASF